MALLELKNLKTYFYTDRGVVKAVDSVSLNIGKGEVVGIVGESGCGKSVTALSILRLVADPPGRIAGGEILFETAPGIFIDLTKISESAIRDIRGRRIAMVFQEPMTALNPIFTVGDQIAEAILAHKKVGKAEAMERAISLLKLVRISAPEERVKNYPHELSGGMRQRVMIAMALALEPEVLIADEPTTALDVTVQAQILELLSELRESMGMALILITHDMGVVSEMAGRVAVMYCGKIVEEASARDIFERPLHPYTRGLLASIPPLEKRSSRLATIPGRVPDLVNLPEGCLFRERCPKACDKCLHEMPELKEAAKGHWVRCLRV